MKSKPMSQNPSNMRNVACASDLVQFPASDGYLLSGTCYSPETAAKAKIVVACATGVPQAFYRRFAEYMTLFGYQVLTFDYRGVAASAPPQLKGFQMSYIDWGRYDLSGAIAYLKAESKLPLFMVGHSYGGQALGLCSNHAQVRAMFCFGTGAGWAGYMPAKEQFKVKIIWNVIFPPLVALSGYLPWSKLKMGADLPKGVYHEWRRWCKNPTYFFADPQIGQALQVQFAEVKTPIYAYAALDDDWALPNSRYAFMQYYRQAPMHFINLEAKQLAMPQIGHMGYFKKDAVPIWAMLVKEMDLLCKA